MCVEDPEWIARAGAELGASHVGYGMTPEMYGWVGDALIATVAEACGDRWSVAADEAWRSAYAQLAQAIAPAARASESV